MKEEKQPLTGQDTEATEMDTNRDSASNEEQITMSSDQIAALLQKVARADEIEQRLLRLQADFDNFRRRTQKEKEEIGDFTLQRFLAKLLPVVDNFDRAVLATQGGHYNDGLLEGVQMIHRQLMETLHREGINEIQAEGQIFDPHIHEAVMQEPADGVEDNTVVGVMQKGYCLKDRVIRPAMVKVARQ